MQALVSPDGGTTDIKAFAITRDGAVVAPAEEHYATSFSHSGWSAQDPQDRRRASENGSDSRWEKQ